MRIEPLVLVAWTFLCIAPLGADPDDASRNWDNKYLREGAGGTWPCPEAKTGFTVVGGKFSIPWDMEIYIDGQGEKVVTVGHFEGYVRGNGSTEVTTRLVSPPPPEFVQQAQQYKRAPGVLQGYKFTALFGHNSERATVKVKGNDCTASWEGDPDTKPSQPARGGEVDCRKGPYAVPPWNQTKRYDAGGYTAIPVEGEATRIFRCTNGCAPGRSPNDGDAAWSLIGHCALAAMPKDGSANWDVTYRHRGGGSSDWRCPKFEDEFKVSHGRFSIPWHLHEGIDVGRIDGVILADGHAVIHPVVTIDKLPPDRSLEELKAAVPTMTFMRDTLANNPRGVGRHAEFQLGGEHNCDGYFYAYDYKEQTAREREGGGWRDECHDDQVWDSKRSYDNGESASVLMRGSIRRLFRCATSPRCDAGQRPDRSSEWEEEGRCK